MIVTVEPRYVDAILTQSDKHHMFARPTWRDGEPRDSMEVLWIKRSTGTIPQDMRAAREKITRYAGHDFRGITLRGAGDRIQLGLRLMPGARDRVQHHFLSEDSLPIQQARGMKHNFMWVLKGMPKNLTPKEVALAACDTLGWTMVAHKELSRPGSYRTIWLVGSEDPAPKATWWIKANNERFCVTIVLKDEDRKGGKGKKGGGGNEGLL